MSPCFCNYFWYVQRASTFYILEGLDNIYQFCTLHILLSWKEEFVPKRLIHTEVYVACLNRYYFTLVT